jgi:hypothetical protein
MTRRNEVDFIITRTPSFGYREYAYDVVVTMGKSVQQEK